MAKTQKIVCKLGKMRKAQEFVLYPNGENEDRVTIQSDKRFAVVELSTKKAIISDGKQSTNNTVGLNPSLGAKLVDVPDAIIAELKEKIGNNHVGPVSIMDL